MRKKLGKKIFKFITSIQMFIKIIFSIKKVLLGGEKDKKSENKMKKIWGD